MAGHACFTQAWEDKTVRERQAREAREVLTPLQVQQMWLEVMGRSLSNTESALVAVSNDPIAPADMLSAFG